MRGDRGSYRLVDRAQTRGLRESRGRPNGLRPEQDGSPLPSPEGREAGRSDARVHAEHAGLEHVFSLGTAQGGANTRPG